MMHCQQPPSILGELTCAQAALDAGDPAHAAVHVESVLALDPNEPRGLALADAILDLPPTWRMRIARWLGRGRPAARFPVSAFIGHHAVCARDLWRRGEYAAAFERLVTLQLNAPHLDFTPWLLDVTAGASRAGQVLAASYVSTVYVEVARPLLGIQHLRPGERAAFTTWAEVAWQIVAMHRRADPEISGREPLAIAASGLLRRAGRWEDARAVVDAVLVEAPSRNLYVMQGLARRGLGDWDGAVASFQAARRLGLDEAELEIGRVYFDAGRWEEALAHLSPSGAVDRENSLAIEACQHALGAPMSETIARLFGRLPRYDEIRRWALREGRRVRMTDATANVIRNVREQHPCAPLTGGKVTVDWIEGPSVQLALRAAACGQEPYSYAAQAMPDHPLAPVDTSGIAVWGGDPLRPEPLRPAPPTEVTERVAALGTIGELVHLERAVLYARAGAAGADDLATDALIAALAYPPAASPGRDPADHVYAWQGAVAMLLAVQDPGRSWLASRRRESLRGLVLGTCDWTTAAALEALAEVLLTEPDALPDARAWLDTLVARRPTRGHCPWADALVLLHGLVPGLRKELVDPFVATADGEAEPDDD